MKGIVRSSRELATGSRAKRSQRRAGAAASRAYADQRSVTRNVLSCLLFEARLELAQFELAPAPPSAAKQGSRIDRSPGLPEGDDTVAQVANTRAGSCGAETPALLESRYSTRTRSTCSPAFRSGGKPATGRDTRSAEWLGQRTRRSGWSSVSRWVLRATGCQRRWLCELNARVPPAAAPSKRVAPEEASTAPL